MKLGLAIIVALGLCGLAVFLPLVLWRTYYKKSTGPALSTYTTVAFALMIGLGIFGFVLGFIGPLVLSPSSAQGPLLSIFTGPLGVVVGMITTWVWFYVRRNEA